MNINNRKSGFTLIELLVSLVIAGISFIVIGMLLSNLFSIAFKGREEAQLIQDYESGKTFIQNEIREGDSVGRSNSTRVRVIKNGVRWYIEKSGNVIRYRRSGGDFIVIMENVKNLKFTESKGDLFTVEIDLEKVENGRVMADISNEFCVRARED